MQRIFTEDLQDQFLIAYAEAGFKFSAAAETINFNRSTIYKELTINPEFKEKFLTLNNTALIAAVNVIIESLHSENWHERKWAVDSILKYNKLSRYAFGETDLTSEEITIG